MGVGLSKAAQTEKPNMSEAADEQNCQENNRNELYSGFYERKKYKVDFKVNKYEFYSEK